MKLLIQPDDSIGPLLRAIRGAKRSIDMYIFRLSYPEVEAALAAAVARGITVRALTAHVAGGRDDSLRKLELRLLHIGVTLSRTDEDLLRYHGKMMIVDRTTMFVLGYNLTRRDIDDSRSLGVATRDPDLVEEGLRLFDADFDRRGYTPQLDDLVVSPFNSRKVLTELIDGAEEELLIYDSRLTDNLMQRVLERRALAGVEVRVIGKVEKKLQGVLVGKYAGDRLHVRAIVSDRRVAFVGSQSLRRAELERRREIGIVLREQKAVRRIVETFEADWSLTRHGAKPRRVGAAARP
jgi:cardiolipin synthase A/B